MLLLEWAGVRRFIILESDALPFPKDFGFDKYLQTSFPMYGTKFTTVDLICSNDVMDDRLLCACHDERTDALVLPDERKEQVH